MSSTVVSDDTAGVPTSATLFVYSAVALSSTPTPPPAMEVQQLDGPGEGHDKSRSSLSWPLCPGADGQNRWGQGVSAVIPDTALSAP